MKNLIMCLIIILMASVLAKAGETFNNNRDTLIINIPLKANLSARPEVAPDPLLDIKSTNATDLKFAVYPNPVANNLTIKLQGALTIKSEPIYLYVFDIKGRVMIELQDICNPDKIYQKELNVSALPKGDFIIKLRIRKDALVKKFQVYY